MTFPILLGLLCLLVVLALVWPLLRARPRAGLDASASQLAVSRDRRREIDRDEQAGRLSAADAEEARRQLAEDLARGLADDAPVATGKERRRWATAAALVVLVPAVALLAYRQVGAPNVGADPQLASAQQPTSEQDVRAMAAELTRQTEADPDDVRAWVGLARARGALADFAGAAEAYGKAAALLPDDARVLADQAEMVALAQGRDFAGRPAELLRQALALDAGNLKANALMSAVYMQAGQRDKALPHLRTMYAALDPNSPEGRQIGTIIDNIANQGSAATGAGTATPAGEPASAQAQAAPATGPASISGSVAIAGEPMADGSVLFISARAASGPRMPYAAIRIAEPTLPMTFRLTDANAMSPGRLLSSAGEVVIEARLSRSGNAMRQSGDRFGTSAPIPVVSQDVTITIDQTVP